MNELEHLGGGCARAFITCRVAGRELEWCIACTTRDDGASLRAQLARWLPEVEFIAARIVAEEQKIEKDS